MDHLDVGVELHLALRCLAHADEAGTAQRQVHHADLDAWRGAGLFTGARLPASDERRSAAIHDRPE